MKNKTISPKNMPVKLPVLSFAVIYLYMDKYHAPGWLWGTVITFCAILLAAIIYSKYNEESTDIFKK